MNWLQGLNSIRLSKHYCRPAPFMETTCILLFVHNLEVVSRRKCLENSLLIKSKANANSDDTDDISNDDDTDDISNEAVAGPEEESFYILFR